MIHVSYRELNLAALDALDVDALAVFVDSAERPLQGLAGLCDWRLCGQLSGVLERGFFGGVSGETLLMPVGKRLGVGRLLAFGIGPVGSGAGPQLLRAFDAAARSGARSIALSLDGFDCAPEEAATAWAEAARRVKLERQVLLGDLRLLGRTIRGAVDRDPEFAVDGEEPSHLVSSPPPRAWRGAASKA